MEGIDRTYERSQQCMEEGDYFTAFELAILCFSSAFHAFQSTDNSSGDIQYTIEESLALIEQTIDEDAEMWDLTQYDEVFMLVAVEAMNTDLDEWLSWRMFFLRSSITLCSDKVIQGKYKKVLK